MGLPAEEEVKSEVNIPTEPKDSDEGFAHYCQFCSYGSNSKGEPNATFNDK